MSDNGHQHHSNAEEWPVLVVGGRALGLQLDDRCIVYPGLKQSGHRQVSNLFNSLGDAMNSPVDTFGQEGTSRAAEGPLDELYVAS